MGAVNTRPKPKYTHEGAVASHISAKAELERTMMCCLLWENSFYEEGQSIADRLQHLVPKVPKAHLQELVIKARGEMKLRHVPLWMCRWMALNGTLDHKTLTEVIQRPDEITEFMAMYWKDDRQPISKQVKKGLAGAFHKFDEYQFAKYNRDTAVKLKDVMFMVHPGRSPLFDKIASNTLKTPDTWEVALSKGGDKSKSWERLLREEKLGGMAILRNLRNMSQAGIDRGLIKEAIGKMNPKRIMPFRFIAAARHMPSMEPALEQKFIESFSGDLFPGVTVVLVDVSYSMHDSLSGKSDMNRLDAACGLAMCLRESCNDGRVFTFSQSLVEVPPRRGFALRDAITNSQEHGGTYLGRAVKTIQKNIPHDRLIVITDEQSHDRVSYEGNKKGYILNVGSYKNGVSYGPFTHITGWSENVIKYIKAYEA